MKGSGLTETMLSEFKAEGWAWSLSPAYDLSQPTPENLAPVWVILFKPNSKKGTPEGQRFLCALGSEEARKLESLVEEGLEPVFGIV